MAEAEEIARAIRYREAWENRIRFRANQLRQLSGHAATFERMWENWRKIYDKTNYIPGESGKKTDAGFEFFTPFDIEDSGGISASPLRLPRTKQSRRAEPGSGMGDPWR